MATGLMLAAFSQTDEVRQWGYVAVWAVALATFGAGTGIAWLHLSAWAISVVDDLAEQAAAAAINTVR